MPAVSPLASAKDAPATAPSQPALESTWSPRLRVAVSAWLLLHLTAVFIEPLHFATRAPDGGASPATSPILESLRWYTGPTYLMNHGYAFFGPDPGPNHLVRYRIEFDDNERKPIEGIFPNLKEHQPRLLYHRHFMLSEALFNAYAPSTPPPEPAPPSDELATPSKVRQQLLRDYQRDLRYWQFQRKQYEAVKASFERHLQARFGGDRVVLTRVEHRLAAPLDVELENRPLNHPDSYVDMREEEPRPPATQRQPLRPWQPRMEPRGPRRRTTQETLP